MKLGGTLITHNCLSQHYCLAAALESLLALCDEVAVVDAESSDGTAEWLRGAAQRDARLRVLSWAWECAPGGERLTVLANRAREALTAPWHFMLQADEVLHEDSFAAVREAMAGPSPKLWCRRLNFWRDAGHVVREGSPHQPVSWRVVRLARREVTVVGDAESLEPWEADDGFEERIAIHHYGFIRTREVMLRKSVAMQEWFSGEVDPRLLAMQPGGRFEPDAIIPPEELRPFTGSHPRFAREWLATCTEAPPPELPGAGPKERADG